jgi:YggT family protein
MLSVSDMVRLIASLITLVVFADILVRFVLNAYHPVRRVLDSVVEPMLAPIRRFLPQTGGWDLSPIVLLLIVQILEYALLQLLAG